MCFGCRFVKMSLQKFLFWRKPTRVASAPGFEVVSLVVSTLLMFTTSCMRTVKMGDPALKPFASMYSVDRSQYGFTPLPKSRPVSIEGKALFGGGYDAMLHFGGIRPEPLPSGGTGRPTSGKVSKRYSRDHGYGKRQVVTRYTKRFRSHSTKRQSMASFRASRLITRGQMTH